jgi:regulation of enolase protein 1 (concanavalin A-like superfamily)
MSPTIKRPLPCLFLATLFWSTIASAQVGDFESAADVGKVAPPGAAQYDKAADQYRISAAGENIWNKLDAFHFVHRKVTGDLTVAAGEIAFVGQGKNAHRKAGVMIRQSLDADAPYVDVMIHGDGLISLQYRTEKGGVTKGIDAKVKSPAAIRLERRGDLFTLFVNKKGEEPQESGSIKLALGDPVHVGLAVCSHDDKTTETAIFSGVTFNAEAAKPAKGQP